MTIEAAQRELDALQAVLSEPALAEQPATASANTGSTLLRIAERVLIGEMAHAQGDNETAISNLERAVRYEDSLTYNEPPDWPQSVRQRLGRVLLDAGRPSEAEAVYWEDLRRNRENGWALRGLKNALEAQGKAEASTQARQLSRSHSSRCSASHTLGDLHRPDCAAHPRLQSPQSDRERCLW